ncbi:hypothetical protein BKA66DRAFT_451118 [Pyrenochaeta sp. MPI-SDFR-AT-0127]|nr:hypothetical protein BKA66DRAFT_451118 [Pyrenochaeta sp. MPI-SDFR-AT-0127]
MAAQRIRKTFKYPTESDDEDAVEAGMDEQDQANLISTLSAHDTSATYRYTLLLLVLPLTPILLYIPRLFSLQTALPSVLAIASLLASAYTLYFLPLPPQEVKVTDSKNTGGTIKGKPANTFTRGTKVAPWEQQAAKPGRRPVPYISTELADLLAENIVVANRAVGGVLALYELWQGGEWSEGFMVGGGYLPLLICMIVLWARTELRIIDMDTLKKLKVEESSKGDSKAKAKGR